MRVLTFNIHGWRTTEGALNGQRVARVIRESRADVVGLNEVYHPLGQTEDSNSCSRLSLLDQIAGELGMDRVFGPCLRWPATDTMPEQSYGNALLSRWPIIASAAHHLAPVPEREQRGLLEARILLPNDRPLTVYVTHLDHIDEAARLTQLRSLRAWTSRDRNRPHLVMGDFNAVAPWDFAQRRGDLERLAAARPASAFLLQEGGMQVVPMMEKAGYVDAMSAVGQAGQGTFRPAAVPLRIDYVFVSQPLVPALRHVQVWRETPGQEASDHRPVLVEISEIGD